MKNFFNSIINKINKQKTTLVYLLLMSPRFIYAAGAGINYSLESKIRVGSFEELLVAILEIFIIIATPIVVLFIIYAGFLYVTARGNVEQTKKATTAFTYAIIGGVIILGAVAIGRIIENLVEAFRA